MLTAAVKSWLICERRPPYTRDDSAYKAASSVDVPPV